MFAPQRWGGGGEVAKQPLLLPPFPFPKDAPVIFSKLGIKIVNLKNKHGVFVDQPCGFCAAVDGRRCFMEFFSPRRARRKDIR